MFEAKQYRSLLGQGRMHEAWYVSEKTTDDWGDEHVTYLCKDGAIRTCACGPFAPSRKVILADPESAWYATQEEAWAAIDRHNAKS